jgi:hypothetical protein
MEVSTNFLMSSPLSREGKLIADSFENSEAVTV